MASKIVQDSLTWLKIAHNMPPRGSETASRRLQEAKEPPKEAPERPKPFKNKWVCLLGGVPVGGPSFGGVPGREFRLFLKLRFFFF